MHYLNFSNKENRTFKRAVRLLPIKYRERYSEEWCSVLTELQDKHQRQRFLQTAMSLALRLRLQELGSSLLGGHGVARALFSWFVLVAVLVLFPFFPLLVLPFVLALVAAAFFYAGLPTRPQYWLMIGSVVVGLIAFSYFWWALGIMIDSHDAMIPVPKTTALAGESLLIMLASIITFTIAAILSFRRSR